MIMITIVMQVRVIKTWHFCFIVLPAFSLFFLELPVSPTSCSSTSSPKLQGVTLASEFCNNITSTQRCVHLQSLPQIIRMLIDIKAQKEGGSAAECSAGLSKRRGQGEDVFFLFTNEKKRVLPVLSHPCSPSPVTHCLSCMLHIGEATARRSILLQGGA